MRSVNKVILIGNLTREPEMKNTTGGQSIVTFGLATNRQWTTSSGEKRSSAEFHECVAWAKLAEICQQRLHKGMLVYVEGYLKTRSWDMEDGTRRFRTEIVLQDMIILEKRKPGEDDYVPDGDLDAVIEEHDVETPVADVVPSSEPAPASAPASATASTPTAPAAPAAPAGELSANIDDDNMF